MDEVETPEKNAALSSKRWGNVHAQSLPRCNFETVKKGFFFFLLQCLLRKLLLKIAPASKF